jgi:hypothetical protein
MARILLDLLLGALIGFVLTRIVRFLIKSR